jgi:hypothetical protein
MELLCSLPFLTPDRYLRLLRLIPLLGTLEIGFELIGEETFRQNATHVQEVQERIDQWHLPDRILGVAREYFEWGIYVSMVLIESAGQLAGWLFNPIGAYRSSQKRAEEAIRQQAEFNRRRLELIDLYDGSDVERPHTPTMQALGYPWMTHLILGTVTIGGLWALISAFPPLVRAGAWLTEVALGVPEEVSWFEHLLSDFLSIFTLIALAGLVVAGIAALVFGVGWALHALVLAALWAFKGALEKVAAALSYKKAYKVLLGLTLIATVLSVFLPNELDCQ